MLNRHGKLYAQLWFHIPQQVNCDAICPGTVHGMAGRQQMSRSSMFDIYGHPMKTLGDLFLSNKVCMFSPFPVTFYDDIALLLWQMWQLRSKFLVRCPFHAITKVRIFKYPSCGLQHTFQLTLLGPTFSPGIPCVVADHAIAIGVRPRGVAMRAGEGNRTSEWRCKAAGDSMANQLFHREMGCGNLPYLLQGNEEHYQLFWSENEGSSE